MESLPRGASVDLTGGTLFFSSDELRKFLQNRQLAPSLLKTTGKSPAQLLKEMPELTYDVVKVMQKNLVGKKNRKLVLDDTGISNVTSKGVSSYFAYDNITSIKLLSLTSFTFECTGTKHPYTYQSPIGMQIFQEITTRRALKRLIGQFSTTLITEMTLPTEVAAEPEVLTEVRGTRTTSDRFTADMLLTSPNQKRANKLTKFFGDTEEQRQEAQITKYLLSKRSPEGKAISHFLDHFGVLEKNILTLPYNIRNFMNSIKELILKEHKEELQKLNLSLTSPEDPQKDDKSLNSVVEYTLQKIFFSKISQKIIHLLRQHYSKEDELVSLAMKYLVIKDQSFFHIDGKLQSPSEWGDVVVVLRGIENDCLPFNQIVCIIEVFKSIHSVFSLEHEKNASEEDPLIISGDDLLPIFIFILVRSSLKRLASLSEYLCNLIDNETSFGEAGYCLAVFASAVQYLKTFAEENPI
eukprot:TRINITY_DN10425_c0_g1_i1.p1 TRINITY_DN10425_c0_g1~~TRINITY_DN10425_c0_g1_i1.p1  ORF type:complete len:467 (-),score=137.32 TRINITY_DN10425_c0_g1_i1:79-1479(-)